MKIGDEKKELKLKASDWHYPSNKKVELTDNQVLIQRLLKPLTFTSKSTITELLECAEQVPPILDEDVAFLKAVITYGVAHHQHGEMVASRIADVLVESGVTRVELIKDYRRYAPDLIRMLQVARAQVAWQGTPAERQHEFELKLNHWN